MGRRRCGLSYLLLVLAGLGGCDRVFELRHVESSTVDAAMQGDGSTCPTALAPDGDEDHDGALNATDPCPRVANEDPHDEDGDATPDVCDLCPTLAGSAAGADADCDGLGAACDPDDAIPHERQFNGFGSSLELTLEGGMTVSKDQLVAKLPGDGDFGRARV